MKKIIIIILSVVSAAAIIGGVIIYRQYLHSKDALLSSEKRLLELNKTVIPSKDATIETLQGRVNELQDTIGAKNQELNVAEEKLSNLKAQLEKEKERRGGDIKGLQEQLDTCHSYAMFLEGKIERSKKKTEDLQAHIAELEENNAIAEATINRLSSEHNRLLSNIQELKIIKRRVHGLEDTIGAKNQELNVLKDKLSSLETQLDKEQERANADVESLQAQIKTSKSHVMFLEKKIERDKKKIEELSNKIAALTHEEAIDKSKVDQLKLTYESLLSDLKEQIQNKELTIKKIRQEISLTFVDRILFDFGKSTLTKKGKEVLKKVGKSLKRIGKRKIRVAGHTDNVPIQARYRYKFPSNWELSALRAAAVVRYLQEKVGLDPKNMEVTGHSFYEPVATNKTEGGRAQNRRVDIIIAPLLK